MAYSQKEIEWLHDNAYMPDWCYYQQNRKSAQENYIIQTQKFKNGLIGRRKVEEQVSEAVEKILDDLFRT